MVALDWKTRVTEPAGADCLIEETLGHSGKAGIALGTPDCLGTIGKASVMRLVLGITEKIGVVLVTEMSLCLSVMGLIGKLWAIRSTQWSLMVRL